MWGDRLGGDEIFTDEFFKSCRDTEAQLYRSYSPNMPRSLILAIESTSLEFMTAEQIEATRLAWRQHQDEVTKARKEGQSKKREDKHRRFSELLKLPQIQLLASNLKPNGPLTPNRAANLAYNRQKTRPGTTEKLPQKRTLRRLFESHKKQLLARQRP